MTTGLTALQSIEQQLSAYADSFLVSPYLVIKLSTQQLLLAEQGRVLACYPVSTAVNGAGCEQDSGKTPLGVHCIAEKIGGEADSGTLFRARKNTREIVPVLPPGVYSDRDAITSRILWLKGLEAGKNQGGNVDSYRRYIYIHGTDEEWRLGKPASHGCIRLSNHSVIELYDKVSVNTLLVILA